MVRLSRSWAVTTKDWRELSHNWTVLSTLFIPAAIFALLPIGIIYFVPFDAMAGELPPSFHEQFRGALPRMSEMTEADIGQVLILMQMLSLLMIVPVSAPMVIATYSVIGEKQLRTLEPLLAAPITTLEILVGKMLAAVLPGIVLTWAAYVILVLAIRPGVSAPVYSFATGPTWLLVVLLVAPPMTILAVNLGVIISSRLSDPRAAQQVGMLIIVPVIAVVIGQVTGLVLLTPLVVLLAAAVITLLAAVTLAIAVRLFDRETILTRWR